MVKKIGITETYDPSFVDDWDSNLKDINIIITKRLSDVMISKLLENKDKCLLHLTCTGYGGTIIEPNVPYINYTASQFKKLLDLGFPFSQCTLRIDPIIPTDKGISVVESVLNRFSEFIEPNTLMVCRVSMIDNYNHVKNRFNNLNIKLPYTSFHAPKEYFEKLDNLFFNYSDKFSFESCAESMFNDCIVEKRACVSKRDIELLDGNLTDFSLAQKCNRENCQCISKVNILKIKPSQCPHRCVYCYWQTDYERGE